MKVLALYGHGGYDQYRLEEWPDPEPGEGEALIEVKACGLNYLDIFVRRGMPGVKVEFPRVTGGDIAGIVRAVGRGADPALVGKRVLVHPRPRTGGVLGEHAPGGLREKFCFEADKLLELPESLSFEQAATLPVAYGSAYHMVYTRGNLQAGELVLVLGASGGVGTACVQLAKQRGCRVIACASSQEKLEKLTELGADHVVNYMEEDFSRAAWQISDKKGVDVAVNSSGGDSWTPTVRAVGHRGRILCNGATAGFNPNIDLRYVWRREQSIIGSTGWTREELESLLQMLERGQIRPPIHDIFPLEQATEAMQLLEDRKVFGKIIIRP